MQTTQNKQSAVKTTKPKKTGKTVQAVNQQHTTEQLLAGLIENQKAMYKELVNIESTLGCLYKVRDEQFKFSYLDKDYVFYLPDLPYDFIQRAIVLGNGFFESELLDYVRENFMHPGMDVVEVGANLGNHAIYFSKVAEAASVISFEPQGHLCEVFRRNLELNQVENVTLHQAVCSSEKGQAEVRSRVVNNLGATQFKTVKEGGYAQVTLDDTISGNCDFLKIDAEGMEEEVIKGSLKLVERCHPVIMVELWDEEHVNNFVRHIAPLGYSRWVKYSVYDYVLIADDYKH